MAHLGLAGEPADPRGLWAVPARQAAARRGRRGDAARCCASSCPTAGVRCGSSPAPGAAGALVAPPGETTRPTADRVRQALFDRLLHAPWAGRGAVGGRARAGRVRRHRRAGAGGAVARRGARVFIERDRAALAALRANIAACRAEPRCQVLAADALRPPPGRPCGPGVPRSALWRRAWLRAARSPPWRAAGMGSRPTR